MRDRTRWYANFAAIPGVRYKPFVSVNLKKLQGIGARPKVERYNFDGKQHDSVMWRTMDEGYTSASPAKQHTLVLSDPTPADILTHLSEVLELPGTASDYHFALQEAHESLWRHRKAEPSLYTVIETICRLDVLLVTLTGHEMYGDSPFAVLAFNRLADMYENEGQLHEALAVYEQAEAKGHFIRKGRVEQLRAALEVSS